MNEKDNVEIGIEKTEEVNEKALPVVYNEYKNPVKDGEETEGKYSRHEFPDKDMSKAAAETGNQSLEKAGTFTLSGDPSPENSTLDQAKDSVASMEDENTPKSPVDTPVLTANSDSEAAKSNPTFTMDGPTGNPDSHIPVEPVKTKKKKGFWTKLGIAAAVGVAAGLCVGAGIYFSNHSSLQNSTVASENVTKSTGLAAADEEEASAGDKDAATKENAEDAAPAQSTSRQERPNRGPKDVEEEETTNEAGTDRTAPVSSAARAAGDVSDVVEEVMPAMVSITNDLTVQGSYFGRPYSQEAEASGSGIIVGDNGNELLIATNQHVVSNANTLGVQFIDGNEAEANLKGEDEEADLAVIAVEKSALSEETLKSIKVATLGDSDNLKVGQVTIAIGNAMGYGQSVTTGVVSALNREVKLDNGVHKLIQTDAAINPGNSGGALLDIEGRVIGINEAKLASSEIEGMGYAIPISVAKPVIELFGSQDTRAKSDEEKRGYLGIAGIDITAEVSEQYNMPRGVYIERVGEGLAADKAGLKKGFIITKFDGQTVQTMKQLQNLISYYELGSVVELTVQEPETNSYGYKETVYQVELGPSISDQIEGNQGNQNGDNSGNSGNNGQNGQDGQDGGYGYWGFGDNYWGLDDDFFNMW
ncbi:MAG: trypsin-like peptidase domain-containing protein [Lachnospiraceae bacterium]|nr:trypsin-like peptidase domain-containing protein [Lachnospiraceae bacterium]